MNKPFPWKIYTKKELYKEYDKLKYIIENIKKTQVIPYSNVGLKCTNYFFQYERLNTNGSNLNYSAIDCWNNKDIRKKIINLSKKYSNNDLFALLVFYNKTPAQFPIIVASHIYKYFNATKVFDPYAGWGDRCLAAMAMNIDYIGVDCNKNLKKCYSKMLSYYETEGKIQIILDKSEKININELNFDLVFSSPPFWNEKGHMIEQYNYTDSLDYITFLNTSLVPVIKKCLYKKIWVCLYIPANMYKDLLKIIGRANKKIKFNRRGSKEDGIIYCWKTK